MQIKSETDPAKASQNLALTAQRHGFSEDAAQCLWEALMRGGGTMAQFSHAEFGGRGQWMGSGMVMVGDMFNRPLAARVDALCSELAQQLLAHPESVRTSERRPPYAWWPAELAEPAATGAQNGTRYAWFPAQRRLAVEREGRLDLFDTAHHVIGGVAQHQGGRSAMRFTSQDGLIDLDTLTRVTPQQAASERGDPAAAPTADRQPTNFLPAATEVAARERPSTAVATDGPPQLRATKTSVETPRELSPLAPAPPTDRRPRAVAAVTHDQVLETLVRLGDLHKSGVLDAEEFRRKKTELLDRL